jgi:anti-sigma regulatory factor (Ser/Thr protein kinase)
VNFLVRRRFEPTPEAVRDARRFFRDAIADQLDGDVTDELTLALSELATNAVLHAETPFEVVIESNGQLRVEVEDGSTTSPVRKPATSAQPGGRGLMILDGVCDRWGVHVVRDRKCVWCERDLS